MRSWLGLQEADIDVTYNVRRDSDGKDADTASPTLRRYHRLLRSKKLPNGTTFELLDSTPGVYLHHLSDLGEFFFTGDTLTTGFRRKPPVVALIKRLPPARYDRFVALSGTVGCRIIFPSNKIDGKMTINGARGCHPRIMDRFDLTVECIRRHYQGASSPLSDVLARYSTFFALFESFDGYVDFFLLQDIVSRDYSAVRFHSPFTGFDVSPVPTSLAAYSTYLDAAEKFLRARNQRILRSRRTSS